MLNLPEPDYYAVSDSDIRPLLMHYRKEVEMHLKQLEKEGGRPVPWEGSVRGLYAEDAVRRIVATAVAAERERAGVGAWQPIATAPKDKELLLWVGVTIGLPLLKQGCWFRIDRKEKGWIDTDGRVLNVTHWMPLPAPPRRA